MSVWKRIGAGASITAMAIGVLAGCTFSANLTVPASKVASTAADALENEYGTRPDIDCGTDDVALVKGTTVECTVTDPDAPDDPLGSTVTITSVHGTDYTVHIDVDNE